jgi:CO/xanthine dehydrogenase Mo-binding subunit
MSERTFTVVGTRPVRHDGVDKVTGRAAYGADASWPDLLHAAIVRSPHAHARIVSIDTSAAEKIPGVKAVLVGSELPETNASIPLGEAAIDLHDMSHSMLARGKVLYHGQAVAAVAATTIDIAREASAKIAVVYEKLQPVMNVDEAMAADAPILHPALKTKGAPPEAIGPTNVAQEIHFKRGDIDPAFREADLVVEREFRTPTVHQGYIEPHACIARCGEDGRATVWCSTQGPFFVRDACAAITGLDPAHVKVIPSEIGGGFGGKIVVYLEPIAILLSRKAQRPVKIVMSRDEVFRASGPTSGTKIRVKIGAKHDGTFVAAKLWLGYEAGAFRGSPVGAGLACSLAPYKTIPNFVIDAYDVVVNKPKVAAYRAPGSPMASFAVESVVDEIARALKMDPIDLRLKNAVDEGDNAWYGPKLGPIGLKTLLEAAKRHPHWKAPLGPNQGRGFALGFWFNAGMNSSATVTLNMDGSAAVMTGNPDIGGTRAAQAIMVAEELGIPVERVRPGVGDTDSAGYTDLTGGSRTCYATGTAVIHAAGDVRTQIKERAAKMWNVAADAVSWEHGRAIPPDGAKDAKSGADAKPLTVAEIAAKMAHTGGPIVGRASLYAPMAGPGFGGHICDLEVDPETGRSRVVRYTAFQDVGKAVHPSYVEGQMQGGVAQGIGWALNEEYFYNRDGAMENAGFLDYRMPVASDLPMIETVLIEVANPLHPYGVRGVGEVPIVPPLAACANAMRAATGVRFTELPLSPPRVLEKIAAASPEHGRGTAPVPVGA